METVYHIPTLPPQREYVRDGWSQAYNLPLLPEWRERVKAAFGRDDIPVEPSKDGLPIWSGRGPLAVPPKIGDVVRLKVNGIGLATVLGYFVEYGFLGIHAYPHDPPEWYTRQNGGRVPCHAFGVEIEIGAE